MTQAAQEPRTFYGLVARRALGLKTDFAWDIVDVGVKVAALMTEDIILRRTAPHLPRGFRVPGYPVTPVLAIADELTERRESLMEIDEVSVSAALQEAVTFAIEDTASSASLGLKAPKPWPPNSARTASRVVSDRAA